MGTYYRIVCDEHKEVLDLNKVYDLNRELKNYIFDNDLVYLISNRQIITLEQSLHKVVINSKDVLLGLT